MSSNPKINPIQAESIMPPHSPKSISVSTDGVKFTLSSSSVAKGGDVTLMSTTSSNVPVYTHVGGSLKDVFNEGVAPYSATTGGGTTYTLKASFSGDVTFDFSDPAVPELGANETPSPNLGGNGTINVGG